MEYFWINRNAAIEKKEYKPCSLNTLAAYFGMLYATQLKNAVVKSDQYKEFTARKNDAQAEAANLMVPSGETELIESCYEDDESSVCSGTKQEDKKFRLKEFLKVFEKVMKTIQTG